LKLIRIGSHSELFDWYLIFLGKVILNFIPYFCSDPRILTPEFFLIFNWISIQSNNPLIVNL
jgi:hypothetical protein